MFLFLFSLCLCSFLNLTSPTRSSVSYQIMKKVAHGSDNKASGGSASSANPDQFAPHVSVHETDSHVKKAAKNNQVDIILF